MKEVKECVIYKGKLGYWEVFSRDEDRRIGSLHDTELDAYRSANGMGYIVK